MATFFNRATLSYSGGVVNSNITSGEIIAPLSISKTAVFDEYSGGSEVTYAVNILNAGNDAINDLTVVDDLGAYDFEGDSYRPLDYVVGSVRYFVNGILQSAPTVSLSDGLQISGIDVPADGVATLLYTARINGFAPLESGSQIENTVSLVGECAEGVSDSEIITVADGADLDITKSLSPTTVTCSGSLTYTIEIINNGNRATVATDNVIVTDVFDPALENLTVTYNGVAWTQPDDYTYDPETGVFRTSLGAITVPAATYVRDEETGEWITVPGRVTIVINGNL